MISFCNKILKYKFNLKFQNIFILIFQSLSLLNFYFLLIPKQYLSSTQLYMKEFTIKYKGGTYKG